MKDDIRVYEDRLKYVDEKIDEMGESEARQGLETEKQELENQLREIDDHKTNGIILRSRCRWHEKGEKSNNYFLRLISRNKAKSTMTKLTTDGGEVIVDQTEILNRQAEYYEQLYTERLDKSSVEISDYLSKVSVPVLEENAKMSCEGCITRDE